MSAAKITQLHVYIIGGVLMLIVGFGLFFTLIKPLNEENKALATAIAGLEQTPVQVDGKSFTIAQASDAQTALQTAQQRRDQNEAKLKSLESKYQLRPGDRIHIPKQDDPKAEDQLLKVTMSRWLQLPKVVVTLMDNYAQKLAKKHGVTVFTSFAAPASVPDPRAIRQNNSIITYQLGGMSVRGDFNKVMKWVEDWNNAPLLVSVDGLKCQLAGKKGEVSATCGLTAYVFPTGPGVTIPGAGGGMAGGMPGAMPGMDPAMMGMDPAMMGDVPGGAPPMDMSGGGNMPGANGP